MAGAEHTTDLNGDLPEGIHASTLDNGIRVVTETIPSVRSASVGIWVGVGSRDERPPLQGATHFLEHLLFKGTESRSALEIARVLDAVGGDMNAFTAKEYTAYYARCLDRDAPTAIDVLSDMLINSVIDPAEVENERDVVLEEIHMHVDTPDDLVHSEFSTAWFGDHRLGEEILGSEESMTAMTRDQVAGWWRDRYTTDLITVAIAGNVEHDEAVGRVDAALGAYSTPAAAGDRGDPPSEAPAESLRVRRRPTEQAHMVLGGRALPRGHDDRYAQTVLNQALGGGMASRLFQEIREKRGLAYSVYSYVQSHADTGTFAVYTGTTPAKLNEAVGVVRDELAEVAANGLTDEEVERAKGYLTGATILGLENTSSRMTRLGRAFTTGSPVYSLDEIMAKIENVTSEDVSRVAQVLCGGDMSLAVVGPLDASDVTG